MTNNELVNQLEDFLVNNYEDGQTYSKAELVGILDYICGLIDGRGK